MNQDGKIMEYRILFQQLQKIQQNVQAVEQHLDELKKIQENLETLRTLKSNTETFIPLGSGLFLKGTIAETETLLMNVGSHICIEKKLPEAVEAVQKQAIEIEQLLTQLEEEATDVSTQLEHLRAEIES